MNFKKITLLVSAIIILFVILSGCTQTATTFDQFVANGDRSFDQGNYQDALKNYERAIELNPDSDYVQRHIMSTLTGYHFAEFLDSVNKELTINQNGSNRTLFLLASKIMILKYMTWSGVSDERNVTFDEYLKIDPQDVSGNLKKYWIENPKKTIKPTSIPTPLPSPKYIAGDIVGDKPSKIAGELILGYDPISDKYATNTFFMDYGKKSWESGDMDLEWYGWPRTVIEEMYKFKLAHVDLNKLKQKDGTPYPIVTPPYPEYNSINEKGLPKSGNYIRVNYDNQWSGTIYTQKFSRSVNGIFEEDFSVDDYGSGCFSKKDASHSVLQVEVIRNGDIVRSESTSNPYGIVCVSV
jgi:tetratricopeptide (TPR) repeat protein